MRACVVSLLLVFVFDSVLSRNVFPNEVVVTSSDVVNGKIENIGSEGETYRLYAVYETGTTVDLVNSISITDSAQRTYQLKSLCGFPNIYFLNENNFVLAPVTVHDPTPQTDGPSRRKRSVTYKMAYTVYLVSTKVAAFPVADPLTSYPRILFDSNDYNGKETRAMTILSAEPRFSLRVMTVTTDSYIVPRGYDAASSAVQDSVLDLTPQNADASFVTIFGPIATMLTKDHAKTGRFQGGFDLSSAKTADLEPGASFTLLSPNWLSSNSAYTSSYTSYSEAFDRQFDFGIDTLVNIADFTATFVNGGSVAINMTNQKGELRQWKYNTAVYGAQPGVFTAKTVSLKATPVDIASPTTYPKFQIKFTSDSGATTATGTTQTSTPTVPTTSGTMQPTTAKIPDTTDPYCACALDKKFGMPDGWDSKQIWLDVVIILDTSEAMGKQSVVDASILIRSLFGTDDNDVIVTDSSAEYYTRIGLIAMSDAADVLYNLNMTKLDPVLGNMTIKQGVSEIDVVAAFYAADKMLIDGRANYPVRVNTRQVIYYMTNSDASTITESMNQFKETEGIIIVNNFVVAGGTERPGLKKLASDGYYYCDIQFNYMATIQLFCKANCYCLSDKDSYAGHNTDPAVHASGGCLHATPVGTQFDNARKICAAEGGGLLTSLHDHDKAAFVNGLMQKAAPNSDYYWIGYSKTDDGWSWEDSSSESFTNWAADEPSSATVAKCAYVDSSTPALYWGAANCNVGFPFACEFAPCAVGNKYC